MSETRPSAPEARLLEAFISRHPGNPGNPRVSSLERVSTGRSRENWLFELEWSGTGDAESLIVRQDPAGGLIDTDRATEFAILRALEAADTVPSPPVRWLDPDGSTLGRPSMVMTRLSGACDYYLINGDRPLPIREGLARRFCELLASVHSVDWMSIGLGDVLTDPGPDAALHELSFWQGVLAEDQLEPYPELVLAGKWLAERAPTSPGTVLVHADFKPGNILLEPDEVDPLGERVSALLDWELTHLGDPHEDLGWITQPLRASEHLIPDVWDADALLCHYQDVSGRVVDRSSVEWWNAFSTFKTAVMQVSGLRAYVEGRIDEPYQPSAAVLRNLLDTVTFDPATLDTVALS